jgi:DNA-binding SARP family transcriptional activator
VDYRVLGPLEVIDDGETVDIGPRKQRSLLALLLINVNRVVATDHILEELWGDDAEGKENALWVYVSRLRAVLEPEHSKRSEFSVLVTRDHGYMLSLDPGSFDQNRFEKGASEGRSRLRADPPAASALLSEALAEWRGHPLQDFTYDDFAQSEITRLTELRLGALEDRIDADLRQGRSGELVAELESLHQQHPVRERLVEHLMLAQYRSGRQADALRTFERFRRHVDEELGIEPSPELRRLEENVLLHDSRIQTPKPLSRRPATPAQVANPFKGLRAFDEDDAAYFFGRDRLVAEVLRRLGHEDRMIGLVGPSGSGKSSVVRAGLIPALRKGAIADSEGWLIAEMVPGSHPFAELEAGLLRASFDAPDSSTEQLADNEIGLLRAALRVLPSNDSKILLVIDQFEELFTLVEDDEVRARFLTQLLAAVDDPQGRVMVVIALRADFYDRPLAYPAFGARLGNSVVNVVPLSPDELEEAARKPAELSEMALEPALLAALLTDVVGQPGALPLFQYTLMELCDRRVGDTLTLDAYRAIDGITGALTRRVNDLFLELNDDKRAVAQQLFLRLVTISEDDSWGRRRVPASELLSRRSRRCLAPRRLGGSNGGVGGGKERPRLPTHWSPIGPLRAMGSQRHHAAEHRRAGLPRHRRRKEGAGARSRDGANRRRGQNHPRRKTATVEFDGSPRRACCPGSRAPGRRARSGGAVHSDRLRRSRCQQHP